MLPRSGTRTTPVCLVDAVWVRWVAAELDRAGLPTAQLLREVGLRREQLTKPDARIPFAAHVGLLEVAARALDEPCFGFRLGSAVKLTETGLVGSSIGIVTGSPCIWTRKSNRASRCRRCSFSATRNLSAVFGRTIGAKSR